MKFFKNILTGIKWLRKLKEARKKRAALQQQKEILIITSLVNEYNLIQEKKSNLSKSQREKVEMSIAALISTGKLEVNINK